MEKPITCVGQDVHKDTIAVALAEAGKRGEVREHGKIANTPAALKVLATKLARNGHELRLCYEAGPCYYGIQRQLSAAGHRCVVVAPSLIPRNPGERTKTDPRDANNLSKLHRAGESTPVCVPDEAHEAICDLVLAREFHDPLPNLSPHVSNAAPTGGSKHRRWLAGLSFDQAVHHIVLEDCITAVEVATARCDRLEAHIA